MSVVLIIAAIVFVPIAIFLFICFRRAAAYPEKRFMNSVLNTALAPLRWLKIGPFKDGKVTLEKSMKSAMKITKLSDFGDTTFVGVYDAVNAFPVHKALKLSNVGYVMYRSEMETSMVKRLKVVEYLKKNPDVLKIPLRSPVFVMGLPRCGTTFLHRLLSLDPAVRSPLLWELVQPVPSANIPIDNTDQSLFDEDRDKRAQYVRGQLKIRDSLGDDSLKHIHEVDADLPEECIFALAEELPLHMSYIYSIYMQFYQAMKVMDSERIIFAYTQYKKQLQMLNYQMVSQRVQPPRWVLKSPMHLFYIPELAAAFPDAKIVWTHRHPASAVPSMCSLAKSLFQVYYENEQREDAKLGANIRDVSADYLLRAVEDIKKTGLDHTHVLYNDLVKDPIGTVKAIYAQYDWDFSAAYEKILQDYLAADKIKRDEAKRQKLQSNTSVLHHYTPEEFSLTYEELSSGNFAKYVEMFKVPMSKN